MMLGCKVEWNWIREDGLYGSDTMEFATKEEVDAFVEKIKSNPYKKVLNCWATTFEKII